MVEGVSEWKNFCTESVVGHWDGPDRGVVESPSLEAFKEQPDVALSTLVWVTRGGLVKAWTR